MRRTTKGAQLARRTMIRNLIRASEIGSVSYGDFDGL
jgi:hypothetical protein